MPTSEPPPLTQAARAWRCVAVSGRCPASSTTDFGAAKQRLQLRRGKLLEEQARALKDFGDVTPGPGARIDVGGDRLSDHGNGRAGGHAGRSARDIGHLGCPRHNASPGSVRPKPATAVFRRKSRRVKWPVISCIKCCPLYAVTSVNCPVDPPTCFLYGTRYLISRLTGFKPRAPRSASPRPPPL